MTREFSIRPFLPKDLSELHSIFLLNVPKYFAAHEINDLNEYLTEHASTYYVIVDDSRIVGACGYHLSGDRQARISWNFVHAAYHGRGLGTQLVSFCITEIRKRGEIRQIEVWTSQLAQNFFAKFGFHCIENRDNYWGKGLHLVRMQMTLDKNFALQS